MRIFTNRFCDRPHCSPRLCRRSNVWAATLAVALGASPGVSQAAEKPAPIVRIVAVQMKVEPAMYRDREAFEAAMDRVVGAAAAKKAKTCPTLVALPEDVGLGLVFLGQMETVKGATTIREAGALLGQKMASDVMERIGTHGVSPVRALLLATNDAWLRDTYYGTFARLAKKHGIYLAAGSAPISRPGSSEVRNVAVLFGPDGEILSETDKVHLIPLEEAEGLDLSPGRVADLPVAQTPFGKVGTAICYDGFHDDVLDHLTARGATIILQPSFNPAPWTKEQETDWATGLWQRLKARPEVRAGVNPMMVGGLWDIVPEGRTNIVAASAPNGYLGRLRSPTGPGLVVVDIRGSIQ